MVIKESGVYKIINVENNSIYVGSAVNLHRRFVDHRNYLRKGISNNKKLQNAWNKYGENAFKFEVIEKCDKNVLIEKEQYHIDTLKPEYNICPIASSPMLGREFTKEHRERISKALRGVKKSSEHNKAVSIALLGHELSEETRLKISETRKREKIGHGKKNPFYGRKHSEETKKKMSIAIRIGLRRKKIAGEFIE